MKLLPVNNPHDTRFASLGQVSASITEAPTPSLSFEGFRVSQTFLAAHAAADVKVGSWVNAQMTSTSVVIVYEAMLMSTYEDPPVAVGDELWIGKYGAGIRIAVSVQDVRANMQLDAYSVALAVDAGWTKCGYEYYLLGGALSPGLQLPEIGPYNAETYETLLAAVDKTRMHMAENAATLKPVLSHVYAGPVPGAANLLEAQSFWAGVACIINRLPEREAVVRAQKHRLQYNAVRSAYRVLVPDLQDDAEPTKAHAKKASAWWDATET